MNFDALFNVLIALSILASLLGVIYVVVSEKGRREIG